MICAWEELLRILPQWMRQDVDKLGKEKLQELRLRINSPPELVMAPQSIWLERRTSKEDILFCVNTASRYSPWAAETSAQGFLTAPGGHRIGMCGSAVMKGSSVYGIRDVRYLCIRVARDIPGIGKNAVFLGESTLILGAPGWGKTTLLRDIARYIAQSNTVAVVDERNELFPCGFAVGKRMDILSGYPKSAGIEMVLRTMGPEYIVVDEITAQKDCIALLHAAGCGVKLLASAHAASIEDLSRRPIYQELYSSHIFDKVIILNKDRTFFTKGAVQ